MSSHGRTRRITRTAALVAAAAIAAPAGLLAAAGNASAAAPTCRTDQLKASWTDKGTAKSGAPTGEQETAVVELKNSGSETCTLKGQPGVSLTEGRNSETLRNSSDKPEPKPVSLDPGKSTTFTLVFLSEKDEPRQGFTPKTAVVTPPGNKDTVDLPWKWGPVTKQESATHPGNWVGPVGASVDVSSGKEAGKSGPGKVDCGSGRHGLSVRAVTTHGKGACPTAHKVADAYGKALDAKKKPPVTVTVNGAAWKCDEKQGKVNPYQECVSTKERGEKVQLLS
ncbi:MULTISPECIES: DUF4232 domain-containing protein [Streptomyces]|nr:MULTISPECIES: DUF4232 domain-containing protein [Streptomyces]NEA01489.1 DUF4232 domain-containing protein [Streptomyces sp. SID10116]MYY84434.1 DUF4232 domain-containing protein [Streptomyces sp. SID335]MYZ17043.1 DUF4232 domain-containing protein [Streptomyces sp. SID337]NDZ88470.1 DUF4232 domain-containing protein [Streptomyces sp. SID10115]NEB47935.1 DUF4232 domain-containing protein [Streptomyces sp. SID339]